MGQNCCGVANQEPDYMSSNEPSTLGEIISLKSRRKQSDTGNSKSQEMDAKLKKQKNLQNFMEKNKLQCLIFNSKGGLYESYLCQPKSSPNGTGGTRGSPKAGKLKLLQSIRMHRNDMKEANRRINMLWGLDERKIEPLREICISESKYFVVNDFIG